jgi:hypothetical protein
VAQPPERRPRPAVTTTPAPGNLFWTYLYQARITTEPLFPSTDHRVLEFGVGLTDLAKKVAASSDLGLKAHYDVDGFVAATMERGQCSGLRSAQRERVEP